jgi:hypothetical protein
MDGRKLPLIYPCMRPHLANIKDRYGEHETALTIALHEGLYLATIMDHYGGHQTALTIGLHGGL